MSVQKLYVYACVAMMGLGSPLYASDPINDPNNPPPPPAPVTNAAELFQAVDYTAAERGAARMRVMDAARQDLSSALSLLKSYDNTPGAVIDFHNGIYGSLVQDAATAEGRGYIRINSNDGLPQFWMNAAMNTPRSQSFFADETAASAGGQSVDSLFAQGRIFMMLGTLSWQRNAHEFVSQVAQRMPSGSWLVIVERNHAINNNGPMPYPMPNPPAPLNLDPRVQMLPNETMMRQGFPAGMYWEGILPQFGLSPIMHANRDVWQAPENVRAHLRSVVAQYSEDSINTGFHGPQELQDMFNSLNQLPAVWLQSGMVQTLLARKP